MEGVIFTKDEALLIEWCLEQMHSDLESNDDLIDYNSILEKVKPFTNVNNYNNMIHKHRRRDLDTL